MATVSNSPLAGQRVLVTRPAHQSSGQCRELEKLGAQASELPMLSILGNSLEGVAGAALRQPIMDLDLYHKIICISPNAARFALDAIDIYWPQLPLGIEWFAVGQRSAEVLQQAGLTVSYSNLGSQSEHLLALAALQQVEQQRILILCGNAGRELLEQQLTARGARVDHARLYRRECPVYDDSTIEKAVYSETLSAILFTSGEALTNFVKVAPGSQNQFSFHTLCQVPVVVPSDRLAELAATSGFKSINVAHGPDDASMVQALLPANDLEANA